VDPFDILVDRAGENKKKIFISNFRIFSVFQKFDHDQKSPHPPSKQTKDAPAAGPSPVLDQKKYMPSATASTNQKISKFHILLIKFFLHFPRPPLNPTTKILPIPTLHSWPVKKTSNIAHLHPQNGP
jgi:hypothetical protein